MLSLFLVVCQILLLKSKEGRGFSSEQKCTYHCFPKKFWLTYVCFCFAMYYTIFDNFNAACICMFLTLSFFRKRWKKGSIKGSGFSETELSFASIKPSWGGGGGAKGNLSETFVVCEKRKTILCRNNQKTCFMISIEIVIHKKCCVWSLVLVRRLIFCPVINHFYQPRGNRHRSNLPLILSDWAINIRFCHWKSS